MPERMALYGAALKGNWDAAEILIGRNPSLVRTAITQGGETALHIAAIEGHQHFVTKLLELMEEDDVNIKNAKGCTSLCFAAAAGHTPIAEIMVSASVSLPTIKGENARVAPLSMAALQGFDEMADFLYPRSDLGSWTAEERIDLLTTAIDSELYGLAMSIVDQHKRLAITEDSNGETPLLVLARNPLAFRCNNRQGNWVWNIMRNVLPYTKAKNQDKNARHNAYTLLDCLWNAIEVVREEDIEAAQGMDTIEVVREEDIEASQGMDTIEVVREEDIEAAQGMDTIEVVHEEDIEASQGMDTIEVEREEDIEAAQGMDTIEVVREEDIEAAQEMDTTKLFFVAAECGNDDFLVELLRRDHNFLYKINGSKHSIFHIAVLHRYVRVFNLMYELVGTKNLVATYIDTDGNNLLHLAGKLAPQNQLNYIPGAALQMQREVLWFKEVEKLVRPSYKNMKNKDGQTPHELFLAEHEGLMKDGEKFMKQTAKACMLVTMLIATVVFTTAFTVPGGYDNNTGNPILQNKRMFMVFPVSEAVATLSSLTSMLMFLSILTSRYSDDDFLRTLPFWLVVGVASLFVSIVAMMVAFCSCLLFFEHGRAAVALLLGFFAIVPTMFVVLKYPLLLAILRCTYSCTWLFRSYDRLHF